jgi:hypothetical protein
MDIRPKETAPSLNFLRSKTIEQLTALLRTAIKEQAGQLGAQQFHQSEELELLEQLRRRLGELSC